MIFHFTLNIATHVDLFADDATLHTSNKNINIINDSLQTSLNATDEWCNLNNMKIHPGKTKCMIITTRQKHQIKPLSLDITLNTNNIEQVHAHKILGLTIDHALSWQEHTNNITKKMAQNTFLLSRLKKFASIEALKMFFNAHINSLINYASTIWQGCSEDHTKKIRSLHKRGVKIICNDQNIQIEQKYAHLKILPFSAQMTYNKVLFTHKAYYNNCPQYITALLKKAPNRYRSTKLIPPLPRINLYKECSFSYAASSAWNEIPDSIRCIENLKTFKTALRKHFTSN
jgi:hypothetical protein